MLLPSSHSTPWSGNQAMRAASGDPRRDEISMRLIRCQSFPMFRRDGCQGQISRKIVRGIGRRQNVKVIPHCIFAFAIRKFSSADITQVQEILAFALYFEKSNEGIDENEQIRTSRIRLRNHENDYRKIIVEGHSDRAAIPEA